MAKGNRINHKNAGRKPKNHTKTLQRHFVDSEIAHRVKERSAEAGVPKQAIFDEAMHLWMDVVSGRKAVVTLPQ